MPWCPSDTSVLRVPMPREPGPLWIRTRRWWASDRQWRRGSSRIPISSSSSRTPVAEVSGARTQLTGGGGGCRRPPPHGGAEPAADLPSTALAAVVIASAVGLFEVKDLMRIYRMRPWEFWLSIVCFVGVAVFGAIPGIGFAIIIAVIEFLWDGWRPPPRSWGAPRA